MSVPGLSLKKAWKLCFSVLRGASYLEIRSTALRPPCWKEVQANHIERNYTEMPQRSAEAT